MDHGSLSFVAGVGGLRVLGVDVGVVGGGVGGGVDVVLLAEHHVVGFLVLEELAVVGVAVLGVLVIVLKGIEVLLLALYRLFFYLSFRIFADVAGLVHALLHSYFFFD
jgi:hypothetical protein